MGKALYRKYRSRSLSEIVGQDHITTTLQNALKSGKIAHAYLLTGPRGVGKTSIARILAHEINSLTYSEEPHFDIIEIDAASNNGVEDVRDLRDKIMSAPASAKYKVFIIDEVHMLSKAAFNALLKTLEEPPEHVVFILATTEAHKLPETIISRTQRFSFRPVPVEQVVNHLRTIAQTEHITLDDDALQLIADHGEGSFRDSISLLDQASSLSSHITKVQVESLLGRVPAEHIDEILNATVNHDAQKALSALHALLVQGYEPAMVARQLSQLLRLNLLDHSTKPAMSPELTLSLLRQLLDIPPAHNPSAMLEVVILRSCLQSTNAESQMALSPTVVLEPSQVKTTIPAPETPTKPTIQQPKPSPVTETSPAPEATDDTHSETSRTTEKQAVATNTDTDDVESVWRDVLQQLKQTHNTLYGIARMARPTLSDDTLTLELSFAFHQKRLSEPRNIAILTKFTEAVRNKPTTIRCQKVSPLRTKRQPTMQLQP
ncbi:DNA polymerase III subunit gamma/tau [Candidatus Saccharibacteria bacterium]|nr:MAG: DNA polymerase III subunit gamma/tau [Candidatus Saccharibacteria bacterium]